MAGIFISHSSDDRSLAEKFSQRLRDQGYHAIFLDFDDSDGILAGRAWERELYAALRRSDAIVFLATATSVTSRGHRVGGVAGLAAAGGRLRRRAGRVGLGAG